MNRHTGRVNERVIWELTHDGTLGLTEDSVTVISHDERHIIIEVDTLAKHSTVLVGSTNGTQSMAIMPAREELRNAGTIAFLELHGDLLHEWTAFAVSRGYTVHICVYYVPEVEL